MTGEEVAVVLASAGRPLILADAMCYVDRLDTTRLLKMVSVPDRASLPPDALADDWEVVEGVRGLAAQRNLALDSLPPSISTVFFFDDDAIIRPDYVLQALRAFDRDGGVVGITGRVLADGKISGEIPKADGDRLMSASLKEPLTGTVKYTRELYGANFAIRLDRCLGQRFDDRLPLYSWLEDHDFARRLLDSGRLSQVDDCVIVHRAAASGGRQSHTRLGYSQVMNPIYLFRKGSFPAWLAAQQLMRPLLKNVCMSLLSRKERAWRLERLRGNGLAGADLLRRRLTPERIVNL